MKATKILLPAEIGRVLRHLRRAGFDYRPLRQQNLIIFRLSCCCGLRVSEIAALTASQVVVDGGRPCIDVRQGKGGKDRTVPLWWDAGTLSDLSWWREQISGGGPFVRRQHGGGGGRLGVRTIRDRWHTAIGCLGKHRVRQLPIHAGRHSFISHSLAAGRSLAEVRDAVGHGSIATTNVYSHALASEGLPDVFCV